MPGQRLRDAYRVARSEDNTLPLAREGIGRRLDRDAQRIAQARRVGNRRGKVGLPLRGEVFFRASGEGLCEDHAVFVRELSGGLRLGHRVHLPQSCEPTQEPVAGRLARPGAFACNSRGTLRLPTPADAAIPKQLEAAAATRQAELPDAGL